MTRPRPGGSMSRRRRPDAMAAVIAADHGVARSRFSVRLERRRPHARGGRTARRYVERDARDSRAPGAASSASPTRICSAASSGLDARHDCRADGDALDACISPRLWSAAWPLDRRRDARERGRAPALIGPGDVPPATRRSGARGSKRSGSTSASNARSRRQETRHALLAAVDADAGDRRGQNTGGAALPARARHRPRCSSAGRREDDLCGRDCATGLTRSSPLGGATPRTARSGQGRGDPADRDAHAASGSTRLKVI